MRWSSVTAGRAVTHRGAVRRRALYLLAAMSTAGSAASGQAPDRAADWRAVDQALGRPGTLQPGGVMKYGFPRSDLVVTVKGTPVKPALALGSWVAFRKVAGGRAMVMGDLVLTETEVAPVMQALQEGGVEQTAIHNHVLGETPRVMYMHLSALGDAVSIARTIRAALARSGTPLAAPSPPTSPAAIDLDTAAVARALGFAGRVTGGVYQVSVPRRDPVREHGMAIPPAMGVATALNFQPTGGGNAAVTGDLVLVADEVAVVMRTLREHGIEVTALHGHMLHEQPRLFFMHFWATGDASTIARGLRAALDRMAVGRAVAGR